MNTNKQQNQGRQDPQKPGSSKKQVLKPIVLQARQKYHEQERFETRMFD